MVLNSQPSFCAKTLHGLCLGYTWLKHSGATLTVSSLHVEDIGHKQVIKMWDACLRSLNKHLTDAEEISCLDLRQIIGILNHSRMFLSPVVMYRFLLESMHHADPEYLHADYKEGSALARLATEVIPKLCAGHKLRAVFVQRSEKCAR